MKENNCQTLLQSPPLAISTSCRRCQKATQSSGSAICLLVSVPDCLSGLTPKAFDQPRFTFKLTGHSWRVRGRSFSLQVQSICPLPLEIPVQDLRDMRSLLTNILLGWRHSLGPAVWDIILCNYVINNFKNPYRIFFLGLTKVYHI